MNWEAAINPTPLCVFMKADGVHLDGIDGGLPDEAFYFNMMAGFLTIFGATPSAIFVAAEGQAGVEASAY